MRPEPPPTSVPFRLTELGSGGGCAAKWGPLQLRELVDHLDTGTDSADLLVGLRPSDDASVLRLTDDLALVSTTDFFPPLVDDPDDFGAIAAANACSDVFAMGGQVRLAVAVAIFPDSLPPSIAAGILAAAGAVVADAGGELAGGHTITGPEVVFGLAVQGTVHPRRIWTKGGARPGDQLVLSKPIGTGVLVAAGDDDVLRGAILGMRRLNRRAAAQLELLENGRGPSACTDVTGYGLVGHSWEMAERGDVVVRIAMDAVPIYDGALDLARGGVSTGGAARVWRSVEGRARLDPALDPALSSLAADPQTSGGLLAAVPANAVDALVDDGWAWIGEVAAGDPSVELS